MNHRRWLFVLLDVFFLAALGGYVIAGIEKVPFHGDESSFIFISRDYDTLFHQGDWDSIRVRGDLWRTREQYLRTMNGAINPYTIGLAWDIAGYSVTDLNSDWRWNNASNQWNYNRMIGSLPGDDLLVVARMPSTLFTVLSIVVLYAIARSLPGGRLAAWIACLIYATTPAILVNGRRAMQEGSFLFATLLVILAAIQVIRAQERGRGWVKWTLALGAASGFALACKHSSAAVIAAAFVTVAVYSPHPPAPSPSNGEGETRGDQVPSPRMERGFRGEVKQRVYTLVAAILLAGLVMLMLLPVWWSLPQMIILAALIGLALVIGFEIRHAARWILAAVIFVAWLAEPRVGYDLVATPINVLDARGHLMKVQAKTTYHQDTLPERVEMLVDQAFFAGTQYFEAPLWAAFEPISTQIAAYEGAHLDGRGGGVMWGALLIALDALGAWWLVAHRRQGTPLLIVGWLVCVILPLLVSPLAWQRYYIVLAAPLSLIAGLGAAQLRVTGTR